MFTVLNWGLIGLCSSPVEFGLALFSGFCKLSWERFLFCPYKAGSLGELEKCKVEGLGLR